MIHRRLAAPLVLLVGALLPAPPVTAALPSGLPAAPAARAKEDPQVLAISIDALNPQALRTLGHRGAPNLWRLVDEGASTLNARTQVEQTVTLPNHTSMVTGRRIDAAHKGHGVTWNDDGRGHPRTVQQAAGRPVSSVFSVAHAHGRSTGLYAAKTKFSLFQRSWRRGIDRTVIRKERDGALVKAVRKDLVSSDRDVTFLHLGNADRTGHASGFMGPKYLAAVRHIDALVGKLLYAVDHQRALADLTIILTADHGGPKGSRDHSDETLLANYRVPFLVWGPRIAPADLYDLNNRYRNPGRRRPGLTGVQPVRNGNLANLALDLLGLEPVPGSLFGRVHALKVR
ncbi:hypothetical protein BH11ACT8_BH11ACT8_36320 [soil metagenome]